MTADQIIEHLGLQQHPEGGWYKETWRAGNEGRPTGTCIYFLLKGAERSHWHRVDATEIWLYHSGAPLVLSVAASSEGLARDHLLTPDLNTGAPQLIVPQGHWQAARTTGDYTLVSCTVSPGFQFEGFELAQPGFGIPRG
ncbi:cupin domain-containing protein [Leisingera methylohalidivorans]|uniref:Cupin n=1 Tax=Leisingera methylohalidivorans DSM 14336 TaxID=999552 RepID=V9VUV6_9RHOB|nr:cupin domain-containing protein [Leisingera methylohalidivorans]AHD01110.1 cupin [Leisingera methylohalidivorans DSM 14336]